MTSPKPEFISGIIESFFVIMITIFLFSLLYDSTLPFPILLLLMGMFILSLHSLAYTLNLLRWELTQ